MALDHFTVTRNTTKTVLNAQGVLETVPANVPGFEFNADGSYKGCLIEPSATNLVDATFNDTPPEPLPLDPTNEYGARFSDGAINILVTGLDASKTYTIKAWVIVLDGYDYTTFGIRKGDAFGDQDVNVDLTKIGEWQFIQETFTGFQSVSLRSGGSGTKREVYTALVQVEEGSVPTSFIPVNGSPATRNADEIVRENAQDLIGQDEGTVFVEVDFKKVVDTSQYLFYVGDGTTTNRVTAAKVVTGEQDFAAVITLGGSGNVMRTGVKATDGLYKMAVTYKENENVSFYINGVKIDMRSISGQTFSNTIDVIKTGLRENNTEHLNSHIRTFALYKRALTQSEAEALTS